MENKTSLNGYEQEVRNIMVMEQLERFLIRSFILNYLMLSLILKLFFELGLAHN